MNRYSHTSAGVFPTRGPTWGKALRKTTQMTSSSAERDGDRSEESAMFLVPRSFLCSRSARPRRDEPCDRCDDGVSQAGEQCGGDGHSPRSRDVVRRLSGRQCDADPAVHPAEILTEDRTEYGRGCSNLEGGKGTRKCAHQLYFGELLPTPTAVRGDQVEARSCRPIAGRRVCRPSW